jgi:hypothetical protein
MKITQCIAPDEMRARSRFFPRLSKKLSRWFGQTFRRVESNIDHKFVLIIKRTAPVLHLIQQVGGEAAGLLLVDGDAGETTHDRAPAILTANRNDGEVFGYTQAAT